MNNSNTNMNQDKKLWIGDLENWMDEKYLQKCLGNHKIDVKNIKLIRDKNTGQPQGYGFLEFETNELAAYTLNLLNREQMPDSNICFKLNWASYSANKINTPNTNEFSIYVSDLDQSINDNQLKVLFSQHYQSVFNAKIIVDPSTKKSKGYGFVKFSDYDESERALVEMNGKTIQGKPIKTNKASYKKGKNEGGFKKDNNNMANNDYAQGNYDPYGQMYYPQQGQDPNMNMYMNYWNYYMANGMYPTNNQTQMYYPNYMNAYYNQMSNPLMQGQPQTIQQGNQVQPQQTPNQPEQLSNNIPYNEENK